MGRNIKKLLDDSFSKFIRLRDADSKGMCTCISCGKVLFWKELDNGHFVNRRHMGTRYDETNCNSQCPSCNRFDEGNAAGYSKGLIEKYGHDVLDILLLKKNNYSKLSEFEMEAMHKHYLSEVRRLKKEKNIS